VELEGALHGLQDRGLGRLGLGEPKAASTAALTCATSAYWDRRAISARTVRRRASVGCASTSRVQQQTFVMS
jgi:hypothetical protein